MISLTVNGVSFPYPQTGDSNWGTGATGWAQAVTTGMLSLAGGSFPLTAQVDFGPNFGIKALSLTTETASPASSGYLRLASLDSIAWRNNANSADILLGKDSSDRLTWNGNPFVSSSGIIPLSSGGTNANLTASAGAIPYLTASAFALLSPGSSGQVLTSGGTGAPTWSSPLTNPMTTLGDLIVGGTAGAATRLAGDTSNTRKFLRELSSGGVATTPAWDTLLAADVPTLNQNTTGTASNVTGTVAIANGGTGQTAKTAAFDALQPMTTGGDLIYGGASGSGTRLANGSIGQVLTSAGGTSAPTWSNRQFVVGTVQASDGALTSSTYAAFTANNPTVSFTASFTGNYKIWGVFNLLNTNATQLIGTRIVATSGSPTVVFTQDSLISEPGASFVVTLAPYAIFTLTAGVAYVFALNAKSGSGQLTLTASSTGAGHVLLAEQWC